MTPRALAGPATLVVYGTYECLHCRRAWPALRALAADAGVDRLRLEWRHFAPPGAFPHATAAAAAVEAAAVQGGDAARAALHEALLVVPAPLWPETVAAVAEALGLDAERLQRDAASDAVRARVAAEAAQARADGVRGTPTVLLRTADDTATRLDARDPEALGLALGALLPAPQGVARVAHVAAGAR